MTNVHHRAHGKQEANFKGALVLQTNCIPAGMATPAVEDWVKEDDTSM